MSELCGCLAAMQIIEYFLSELNESSKIEVRVATDCLGVMCTFKKQTTVISMETKLNHVIREFLLLKPKRLKYVAFVKVEAHQYDAKSYVELSFFE